MYLIQGVNVNACRQQAPVDKLLFLQRRVQNQLSTSAILVSSEAGQLHFWSLYGRHRHIGAKLRVIAQRIFVHVRCSL